MTPWRIIVGDCREALRTLPAGSVQTCVTSPPYWGLRDYGNAPSIWGGATDCVHCWGDALPPKPGPGNKLGDFASSGLTNPKRQNAMPRPKDSGRFCVSCGAWCGCLGLEPTPDLFVAHLVEVFLEVHRVLRPDGTLWLNLGDCYATGAGKVGNHPGGGAQGARWRGETKRTSPRSGHHGKHQRVDGTPVGPLTQPNRLPIPGLKAKDLVGVPWMVAFALRASGWFLRMDNVWHKPNPMPESVTDRPTKAHEYVFLLSKSGSYFYDKAAVMEPVTGNARPRGSGVNPKAREPGKNELSPDRRKAGFNERWRVKQNESFSSVVRHLVDSRNMRSVWTIGSQPFKGAHFAVMPPDLAERCILAGSTGGGIVLDPFAGAGTVGLVANRLGREFVGIELNPKYAEIARERIIADAPLLNLGVGA